MGKAKRGSEAEEKDRMRQRNRGDRVIEKEDGRKERGWKIIDGKRKGKANRSKISKDVSAHIQNERKKWEQSKEKGYYYKKGPKS